MRYLSAKDLLALTSTETLVAAIEQALRDFAANRVAVPARQHTSFGGGTLLTMPVAGEGMIGVKAVSVVPSNAARNLPLVNGLMMVCDGMTGVPLAVLDAAILTAQRTGAVGAIGLKYTTPQNIDRIGIVGTGVQATWQAIFACAVRSIGIVYFVARSNEKAQRFVQAVSRYAPSARLSRCKDVQELIALVPVVIAATSSSVPVLPNERECVRGKHFVSVGSYKPSMQELPDAVYGLAQAVVVDSNAASSEAGDLIGPLSSGLLQPENIIHLADLVAGKRTVDTAGTTVFKSVGLALYDLYAARALLSEAERRHVGVLA